MDAELVWAALGTLASAMGVAIAWRQLRLEIRKPPGGRGISPLDVPGASVLPPSGRLPPKVRGRDHVLDDLLALLRKPPGEFVVLSGMGGVGKSTVAALLAVRARNARVGRWWRVDVWWVSAADPSSLTSAMVTVARQLDASGADLDAIAAGRPDAPDRLWALLDGARRRWLLILDNADEPEVLARPVRPAGAPAAADAAGSVRDGNGWVRPSQHGLVVVTSRDASASTWGRHARVINLEPLDELDAARVLLDWAPDAGSEPDARNLASRLGRLPLALGLAGSYLHSDVALRTSFPGYQRSLDDHQAARLLLGDPSAGTDQRTIVIRTWEVSLDALARRNVPQARALLRLLSCYAASTPIPLDLLDPQRLVPLLASSCGATPATAEWELETGLGHLRRLRLIETRAPSSSERALSVHPVIADTNRAHLEAETSRSLVQQTSVDLVVQDASVLKHDEPVHWPRYHLLAPHLAALLKTTAPHLDDSYLGNLVTATAWVAAALDRSGALAAAERLSRSAFAVLPALDDDDPASLLLRHILAWETAIQGRPAEAEIMYRDVFARRQRILGPDHPETLQSRHELAWVTTIQGRPAEAEAMYRTVLDRRVQVLGNEHPETLITRHELAWAIASQGRGDEAEAILHDVAEARTRVLGPEHPRTVACRHELAWAIAVQGRWDEAEAVYRQALSVRRRILGVEHHETLTTEHELAWTIAMQGRHREAIAAYEAVLTARRDVLGSEHPDTVTTKRTLENLRNGKTTPAHHIA